MAQGAKDEKEKLAPIIIKRVKKVSGGHHGGAWKVAYADFVTAMMAFFLLLWLLNVTTEEQKNAISNYFDPSHPKVSDVVSGAGGILAGMSMAPVGAMVTNVQPIVQTDTPDTSTRGELKGNKTPGEISDEDLEAELRKREDKRFEAAAAQLKKDIAASPELKDLQKNIIIDITPEGLRIQIVDDQGRSMFPSGSAKMYDFMRQILLKVTNVIVPMPNQVSVRGHTDSNKYKDPSNYDNWNLSADRAQASRRVMTLGGLPEKRIENVMGRADREHLVPKEPANARNRRISIILLRERLTQAQRDKMRAEMKQKQTTQEAEKEAAEIASGSGKGKTPALQIVDDTQEPIPAPAPSEATQDGGDKPALGTHKNVPPAQPNEFNQPQNKMPLPVMEQPETFKRQPQVMYFGDSAPKNEQLYEGPTQSPFVEQKGPRTITTPAFELPSNPKPVQDGATPAVTPPKRAITFGDPVPAPHAPTAPALLPEAPGLTLDNNKANTQMLEFGDVPAATPAPASTLSLPDAPALELVNPADKQPVKTLDFGDSPTTQAPAITPDKRDDTPASDGSKELQF